MRTVSISYLPGPNDHRFDSPGFVQNLIENPPAGDLILFSDHPQPVAERAGFKVIVLEKTVELPALKNATIVRPQTGQRVPNPGAINHLIWLTALRIAEKAGYSHALYLEEDVRVKNHPHGRWDEVIFREFFAIPRPLIMGGSIRVFNPYNGGMAAARRFERFFEDTKKAGRKMPLPVFTWKISTDVTGSAPFSNGAGSVLSIAGINLLYPERAENNDIGLAQKMFTTDLDTGVRLWNKFGVESYDLIGELNSVFSTYGNGLTTREERLAMLDQGLSLCHQVKREK
jgi:hypothetical protein